MSATLIFLMAATTPSASVNFEYDELGRVIREYGNYSVGTSYTYDDNSNLKTITDAEGHKTTLTYDGLDRLTQSQNHLNGLTKFEYDAGDRPTKVTDPRSRVTTYAVDGFGQVWSQTSPDTGATSFSYTATGLPSSMTRADAKVTTYGHDGLGRLTSLTTNSGTQTLTYDNCTNGKGRLCKVTDPTGNVSYTYTPQGQVATQVSAMPASGASTYAYSYDGMGRLAGISYPGGIGVGYGYVAGQLTTVTATIAGVSKTVASNINYQPFGPATGWTYGNGLLRGYNYDLDGRRFGLSVRNGANVMQSLTLGYDDRDMVTAVTNAVSPSVSQTYQYDDLGRLIHEERDANRYNDYTHDANGNRTSSSYVTTATTYTVSSTSNRLLNVGATAIGYDPNGNVTSDGTNTFVYDAFNRMSSASGGGGAATYAVNGLGQRVYKKVGTTQTWFSYAPDGSSIGEYKSGQGWSAYVWANGEIIGMVRGGQLYSVHNDHIGRPELITNSAKAVVWKADNYGFTRLVRQDAIGAYNVGFPGQYFDAETDTWNNGFRTYDHSIGRYLQSDPIGLAGGVNTYAYVGGNPVNLVDPFGLKECPPDVLGAAFGVADVLAGLGEIALGLPVFVAGALSGTDDGATGVAIMAYGGLTMADGGINIMNGFDGKGRPSAFEQAGGLLGAEGAAIGKAASWLPTPSHIGNGVRKLIRGTMSDNDAIDTMKGIDQVRREGDPCGCP